MPVPVPVPVPERLVDAFREAKTIRRARQAAGWSFDILTHTVARVPGRSSIDSVVGGTPMTDTRMFDRRQSNDHLRDFQPNRGRPSSMLKLRDMRRDRRLAALSDEVAGVVVLVGAERHAMSTTPPGALRHYQTSIPLRGAVGRGDDEVGNEPIARPSAARLGHLVPMG